MRHKSSEAKPTGGSPGVFLRQPLGAARSAGVKNAAPEGAEFLLGRKSKMPGLSLAFS